MDRKFASKVLLGCAVLCPFLMLVGGLSLYSGYTKTGGMLLCIAGTVDLLGYSTALYGVTEQEAGA